MSKIWEHQKHAGDLKPDAQVYLIEDADACIAELEGDLQVALFNSTVHVDWQNKFIELEDEINNNEEVIDTRDKMINILEAEIRDAKQVSGSYKAQLTNSIIKATTFKGGFDRLTGELADAKRENVEQRVNDMLRELIYDAEGMAEIVIPPFFSGKGLGAHDLKIELAKHLVSNCGDAGYEKCAVNWIIRKQAELLPNQL